MKRLRKSFLPCQATSAQYVQKARNVYVIGEWKTVKPPATLGTGKNGGIKKRWYNWSNV